MKAKRQPLLTPWFEDYDRPVRSGVYEVAATKGPLYAYWTVETGKWGLVSYSIQGAQGMRDRPSYLQYRRWRGVAANA